VTVSQKRLGLLFILVAPAGAGKNALLNIAKTRVEGLTQLPTATTRPIREGEQQGREHLFVTPEQFQHMIDNGELLEWQEVHGRYYGMPRATVEQAMDDEQDMIADIDYKGATYIRSLYPDNVVLIYIQPPSIEVLIERMRERGETEAEIGKRLMRVPAEMGAAVNCDYLIVNENIEYASDILTSIIVAKRSQRDMLKLRAETPDKARPLFFAASAIVVCNDEVLYREAAPHFPTTLFTTDEQPQDAALRAVREQLGVKASLENLAASAPSKDNFLPPIKVDCGPQGTNVQLTMVYVYRLSARITPPSGWTWISQDTANLPSQVLSLLAASPSKP
jgi:guanylate kinase